jgi:hypothetical protein
MKHRKVTRRRRSKRQMLKALESRLSAAITAAPYNVNAFGTRRVKKLMKLRDKLIGL